MAVQSRTPLGYEDEDVDAALGDYDISLNNDFNNRKRGDKLTKALRNSMVNVVSSPTIGPICQN